MLTNGQQLKLRGTHGTCRTHVSHILRIGFISAKGRHGCGVYFWSANSDDVTCSQATKLAMCYAQDMAHQYQHENDPSPRVLICDIHVTQESFLDIESDLISRLFREYVITQSNYLKDSKKGTSKSRASKVADAFVALMEETSGVKYDVIHTKTVIPHSLYQKLSEPEIYLGMGLAGCYIVRNLNCVPLQSIVIV